MTESSTGGKPSEVGRLVVMLGLFLVTAAAFIYQSTQYQAEIARLREEVTSLKQAQEVKEPSKPARIEASRGENVKFVQIGDERLVLGITWDDALAFLNKGMRSESTRLDADTWLERREFANRGVYAFTFTRTTGPYVLTAIYREFGSPDFK